MTFEEAKEHLDGAIQEDGSIYDLGWYLAWNPKDADATTATLDGEFTADELEAIAIYMREKSK